MPVSIAAAAQLVQQVLLEGRAGGHKPSSCIASSSCEPAHPSRQPGGNSGSRSGVAQAGAAASLTVAASGSPAHLALLEPVLAVHGAQRLLAGGDEVLLVTLACRARKQTACKYSVGGQTGLPGRIRRFTSLAWQLPGQKGQGVGACQPRHASCSAPAVPCAVPPTHP